MAKRPLAPRRPDELRKLLTASGSRLPETLSKELAGQASPEGESIYATALQWATPAQVARGQEISGPLNSQFFVESYRRTQNPFWLWLSLLGLKDSKEVPPEAFQYLQQIGRAFFSEMVTQLLAFEHVRITPGKEVEEGIAHIPKPSPPPREISEILGLSAPGRKVFRAAAQDFHALNTEIAIADLVKRSGCSREEAFAFVATVLGRVSPESGPSSETVRKVATRAKRFLPRTPRKASK